MKISWETKSLKLYNTLSKCKKDNRALNGGNLYDFDVYKILSEKYKIIPNFNKVKHNNHNIFKYIYYNNKIKKDEFDFIISDPYSFVFSIYPK